MKYYLKELISRKLFLPNGAPVPFEPVGGDYGLLQTADEYLIGEMDKAIKTHVGGVVPLTEAEYTSWQEKKRTLMSSSDSSPRDRETLGPIPFQQLQAIRAAGRAAEASVIGGEMPGQPTINPGPGRAQQQAQQQKVEPISTPSTFSKPRVGRIPKPASSIAPPAAQSPAPAPAP